MEEQDREQKPYWEWASEQEPEQESEQEPAQEPEQEPEQEPDPVQEPAQEHAQVWKPKFKFKLKVPDGVKEFCAKHNLLNRKAIAAAVVVVILLLALLTLGHRTDIIARPTQLGLRDIGELATQEARVTSVQTIEKARALFGLTVPGTTTKRIFSYDCRLTAGLDFGAIEISENAESKTVTVKLPEIRVLSNEIDPNSMQLYDEKKSMFAQLNINDMNESLVKMRDEVEANAIHNGLLENARTNAEALIRAFMVSTYKPDEWTIVFEGSDEA